MIGKAKRYIEYLEREGEPIMIPTPVLLEYLVGSTVTERREREIFERGFYHPGLDIPSAELAAELLRDTGTVSTLKDGAGFERQIIRTDVSILAIAITHKAAKFVTHNPRHFKTLAKERIAVEELPDIQEQGELNLS